MVTARRSMLRPTLRCNFVIIRQFKISYRFAPYRNPSPHSLSALMAGTAHARVLHCTVRSQRVLYRRTPLQSIDNWRNTVLHYRTSGSVTFAESDATPNCLSSFGAATVISENSLGPARVPDSTVVV